MDDKKFTIVAPFVPAGDQISAIEQLTVGFKRGDREQVLLGATGTGKTFTIAKLIEAIQKPTLVIAHNKTLAAQLASEFKAFFPDNAVEYFVSYYDYYQPEAYIPNTDTYIEKDAAINDEIDRLRHSATSSLIDRRDVIVVASVSCIYGLGSPEEYKKLMLSLRTGQIVERNDLLRKLVNIQYTRNDLVLARGSFRVHGDIIEVFPVGQGERVIRIELFGDEIERLAEVDVLTGALISVRNYVVIYPASHYATSQENLQRAVVSIESELAQRLVELKSQNKLLEVQRLEQRTNYDLEMMQEIGYCNGIENYSRHITNRKAGEPPYTLMDYFPDDYLLVVDESHVTLPQIRAMYAGDRSRKDMLVNFGFRLPSAYDNRPLTFAEFDQRINKIVFVSATPGPYEYSKVAKFCEQVNRPTGLLDPVIITRPVAGQIEDLLNEIKDVSQDKQRVLVTTLTKKMAEDLTDYLSEAGIKVRYLHSDICTIERAEIVRDLRRGIFDVLVGINLLREGLDLPEVALVAILDADKEGFLRSSTSLIQTIGRAARNEKGRVIMYADKITDSMCKAIDETERRRKKQFLHNKQYNIIPRSIKKSVINLIETTKVAEEDLSHEYKAKKNFSQMNRAEKLRMVDELRDKMKTAARRMAFEEAAQYRDMFFELCEELGIKSESGKK